jgi:hypothetical protein
MLCPVDASISVLKISLEFFISVGRQGLQGPQVLLKRLALRSLRLLVHLAVFKLLQISGGSKVWEKAHLHRGDCFSSVGASCGSAFPLPRDLRTSFSGRLFCWIADNHWKRTWTTEIGVTQLNRASKFETSHVAWQRGTF